MIKKLLKSFSKERVDTAEPQQYMLGKSTVSIGRYTYGTKLMEVLQWGEGANLTIGSFCSVAKGLQVVLGGNHRVDWITTFPFGFIHKDTFGEVRNPGHPGTNGDVTIGHDVWIGTNVTILSGITIGDGAVIAANATVVKDVGAYEIWGGNPARHIKARFDDETVAALRALEWWNLPEEQIRELVPMLSEAPDIAAMAQVKKRS